jgi:SAM-dependent methyltransferase
LMGCDVPLHKDRWKNWDNMLATVYAVETCDQDDDILDAGGTRDPGSPSVFLPGLAKLGYTGLISCNLDEGDVPVHIGGVLYCKQNIERTSFRKDQFKFIACLSVIEHGVDWREYYTEMFRILEPGGKLFTSFDYWPTYIDTGDRMAFGAPVRIFTKDDVTSMIALAARIGLTLPRRTPPPKFDVKTPTVNWLGLDYTFYNLLLQKPS